MRPSRRSLVAGAAAVAILVVAFVALTVARVSRSSATTDCDSFAPTPARWRSATYDERVDIQDGLVDCHLLIGRTPAQVAAQIGPPDATTAGELRYELSYGDGTNRDRQVWRLYLVGGRVKSATTDAPAAPTP